VPPRRLFHLLALLAAVGLAGSLAAQDRWPRRRDEPEPSCRADYTMRVRYEEPTRRLFGDELVVWHNETSDDVPDLWFHLYWNGFANNRSTHLTESGGELRGIGIQDEWGWQRITSIQVQDQELVQTLQWRPVDDGRADDKSVFSVKLPRAVRPGETLTARVQWEALIPRVRRRTGYKDDFLFIAHWFPQLGVYEGGNGWNCHQFHAWTEFFSDYGVYDVTLDLPAKYAGRIGASGVQTEPDVVAEGRVRARFVAPSPADQIVPDSTGKLPLVHGFTWTADADYVKYETLFDAGAWARAYEKEVDDVSVAVDRPVHEIIPRDVRITVLLQPEHADQAERHADATRTALFFYGLWFGGYPYEHITCVDPTWGGGAAGGMEYPTLFTAGTRLNTFPGMHTPESVTVHECGHQFWYGLVGNNEFEAAWLDEGFNTYTQNSALMRRYGNSVRTTEYAGFYLEGSPVTREPGGGALGDALTFKRWSLPGLELRPLADSGPLEFWRSQPLLAFARGENHVYAGERAGFLSSPDADPVDLAGWRHVDSGSYRQNSYRRTAMNLRTLEGMVGRERFLRGMRLYAERFRYEHPYPQDFFDTFCEGAEGDALPFLEQAFRSTANVDWSVEVRNRSESAPAGWFLDEQGAWVKRAKEPAAKAERGWSSEVVVRRKGQMFLPLKVAVRFADGTQEDFLWSAEEQRRQAWLKPLASGGLRPAKVTSVILDPEQVYTLDLDLSDNAWHEATESATPLRWGERVWSHFSHVLHWFGGLGG